MAGNKLESSFFKRKIGISFSKMVFVLIGFVLLLVAVSGGLKGPIEGTYKWKKSSHESSFTLNGKNIIVYESDGMGFGPVYREGKYTVDKGSGIIKTHFDDGLAPYQIDLISGSNKWSLKYASTLYEK